MYRSNEIKTGLLHLIGWRPHYDTAAISIADSLSQSESGEYFQDVHPLLTLENLKAIAPDFKRIDYPAWNQATQYRIGDRVTINQQGYRAKAANINTAPETSPEQWERFDPFSEWIEQKTQASIMNALRTFWTEKMEKGTARNILENKVLFDGAGRMTDTIATTNSLVGFELVPVRAQGVTLRVNKIGLQFNAAGIVRMYLLHSSQRETMKINGAAFVDLLITKPGSVQWFDMPEMFLPYLSDETDAGGSWFLCYDERELTPGMKAINKEKDWSSAPCSGCSRTEYAAWQAWSRYLEVHPFKVSEDRGEPEAGYFENPPQMWDISSALTTYTTSYGINLQITLECDVTDVILQQKGAFKNLIGLQAACDLIREFVFNPAFRIGRAQQNFSRVEMLYELDGDAQSQKPGGLVYQRNKALAALNVDTKELSRVCFPCNNGGIKYRTV